MLLDGKTLHILEMVGNTYRLELQSPVLSPDTLRKAPNVPPVRYRNPQEKSEEDRNGKAREFSTRESIGANCDTRLDGSGLGTVGFDKDPRTSVGIF